MQTHPTITRIDTYTYVDEAERRRARRYYQRRYRWPWRKPPYPEFIELCARKAATREMIPLENGDFDIVDGWGEMIERGILGLAA